MVKLKAAKIIFFVVMISIVWGCSDQPVNDLGVSQGSTQAEFEEPGPVADEVDTSKPRPTPMPPICSALNFEGVRWPQDYLLIDQQAFSLAMNITGSFEGHAGWTNLSNNFDGQGVSMGILNQNLGQGTLQPLFITMRDNHPEVLENAMTPAMLKSLLGMLADWERSKGSGLASASQELALMDAPERAPVEFHDSDVDKKYAVVGLQLRSNSASVRWAKNTLYSDSKGRKFKTAWKNALKEIAGHPLYVSQQILAARYIHDRTLEYKNRLGWQQLRSYLFLFDIVVQNGSLREKHFDKYDAWMAEQAGVTEEEQMLEMLEIRVVDSHKKWQADVRKRKTAIILGTGFVHGEDRNLPVEYCYDPVLQY